MNKKTKKALNAFLCTYSNGIKFGAPEQKFFGDSIPLTWRDFLSLVSKSVSIAQKKSPNLFQTRNPQILPSLNEEHIELTKTGSN